MRVLLFLSLLFCSLFVAPGAHAETQKLDPLFKNAPLEMDKELVVEVVDWGWLGAIMRRGRLRLRQNEFNRLAALLNASSKKGGVNRDMQAAIKGVSRNSRGSVKGLLPAIQNLVILIDAAGKTYVWNTVSGAPVEIPKNDRLFEQIEALLPRLPGVNSDEGSLEEFLEAFESGAEAP